MSNIESASIGILRLARRKTLAQVHRLEAIADESKIVYISRVAAYAPPASGLPVRESVRTAHIPSTMLSTVSMRPDSSARYFAGHDKPPVGGQVFDTDA